MHSAGPDLPSACPSVISNPVYPKLNICSVFPCFRNGTTNLTVASLSPWRSSFFPSFQCKVVFCHIYFLNLPWKSVLFSTILIWILAWFFYALSEHLLHPHPSTLFYPITCDLHKMDIWWCHYLLKTLQWYLSPFGLNVDALTWLTSPQAIWSLLTLSFSHPKLLEEFLLAPQVLSSAVVLLSHIFTSYFFFLEHVFLSLCSTFRPLFRCFLWEVCLPPLEASILSSSPACPYRTVSSLIWCVTNVWVFIFNSILLAKTEAVPSSV